MRNPSSHQLGCDRPGAIYAQKQPSLLSQDYYIGFPRAHQHRVCAGAEMVMEIERMLPASFLSRRAEVVDGDPVLAWDVQKAAAMSHSVRQSFVAVVFGLQILRGKRGIAKYPRAHSRVPAESSAGFRLIETIDGNRIMGPSRAKVAAPCRRAVVHIRSGVDQQFPAAAEENQGQGVGVRVAAGEHTESAGIEHEVAVEPSPAGALNGVTRARKYGLIRGGRRTFHAIESLPCLLTKEPERLFTEIARLVFEITPLEQRRAQAQTVVEGSVISLLHGQGAAAVVIPQQRNLSGGRGEMHDEVQHPGNLGPNTLRKPKMVRIRQHQRLQVKVQGVAVVAGR